MENMGIVSSFDQIGSLLFGDDVNITYDLDIDHVGPDGSYVIFDADFFKNGVQYKAHKQYRFFETKSGIIIDNTDHGDLYFEKDKNFRRDK